MVPRSRVDGPRTLLGRTNLDGPVAPVRNPLPNPPPPRRPTPTVPTRAKPLPSPSRAAHHPGAPRPRTAGTAAPAHARSASTAQLTGAAAAAATAGATRTRATPAAAAHRIDAPNAAPRDAPAAKVDTASTVDPRRTSSGPTTRGPRPRGSSTARANAPAAAAPAGTYPGPAAHEAGGTGGPRILAESTIAAPAVALARRPGAARVTGHVTAGAAAPARTFPRPAAHDAGGTGGPRILTGSAIGPVVALTRRLGATRVAAGAARRRAGGGVAGHGGQRSDGAGPGPRGSGGPGTPGSAGRSG